VHATPLPVCKDRRQHPLEERHDILFGRLHEEVEPVFAEKSTVSRRTVNHTLFTVGPAQISLLPCSLHHPPLDVQLSVVCVILLYRTILDELFPMLSVKFSRMLCDLSPFTSQDVHSFFY
jgi:hypothetical protein